MTAYLTSLTKDTERDGNRNRERKKRSSALSASVSRSKVNQDEMVQLKDVHVSQGFPNSFCQLNLFILNYLVGKC